MGAGKTGPTAIETNRKYADFDISPGLPKFTTGTALSAGSASLPAGSYTVGVIKNGAEDWTMALSPGELAFGDSTDMSKLISDSGLVQ